MTQKKPRKRKFSVGDLRAREASHRKTLIAAFENHILATRTKATARRYSHVLSRFIEFDEPPLEQFKLMLQQRGNAPNTVAYSVAVVHVFLNWCLRNEAEVNKQVKTYAIRATVKLYKLKRSYQCQSVKLDLYLAAQLRKHLK